MTGGSAALVWKGKEYELRYTFEIIRRLRAEGVNVPAIYRKVKDDALAIADYQDELAVMVSFLLRSAGATASAEEVWRESLSDRDLSRSVILLFYWIVTQHYAQSNNLPPSTGKDPAHQPPTSN